MKGTRFVIIDNDEADRKIYKRMIDSYFKSAHEVVEYSTGREAIAELNKGVNNDLDILENNFVLLEYQLPDTDGVSLLKTLRDIVGKFTPIVMLTSHGNEKVAVNALKKGAFDYLVKDNLAPSVLIEVINRAIKRAKNKKIKQIRSKKCKLHTHYDSQTGLLNRQTFEEIAKKLLVDAANLNRALAIMIVGIDNLPDIQDQSIIEKINTVLEHITETLSGLLPSKSVLARYSENEFIILLNGSYVQTQLSSIANKIEQSLEKMNIMPDIQKLLVSVGVACYPDSNHVLLLNQFSTFFSKAKKQLDTQDQIDLKIDNLISVYAARLQDDFEKKDNLASVEMLINNAIESREKAKKKMTKRVEFFSENSSSHRYRELEIELGLHEALSHGKGLSMEYQPVYVFGRKEPFSIETKLIWEHPRLGIIDRDEYYPIAERLNIATSLDVYSIDFAAADFLKLSKLNDNKIKISRITLGIDFTSHKVSDIAFLQIINGFIDTIRFPLDSVELQLNEVQLKELMVNHDIKKLSTRCTLQLVLNNFVLEDLFLKELNSLPITSIKMSRSLIQDMLNDKRMEFIVRSIAMLGKDIKVDVIADGVSTQEQYQFLMENACGMGQGSYFHQAVKGNELINLSTQNSRVD